MAIGQFNKITYDDINNLKNSSIETGTLKTTGDITCGGNVTANMYYGSEVNNRVPAIFEVTPIEGIARVPKSSDMNDLTSSGISMGVFQYNTPITSSTNIWYFVVSFNHDNYYFYQIAIPFNFDTQPSIYGRICMSYSWKSWYQLSKN